MTVYVGCKIHTIFCIIKYRDVKKDIDNKCSEKKYAYTCMDG